jgi:DDE superfamily endonuclease
MGWVIPPDSNAEFVAAMENVLDVYRRPYDASRPVVCMDETPRQLIGQVRTPIAAKLGQPVREDYEYVRLGTCNVFMASEPLAGRRITKVTERKTKIDWAHFIDDIAQQYPQAERITLVMDNLNTHTAGSLYETFAPDKAKALWDRFEFVYTPKHGSWLNMAEIELNVMIAQCLNRRIDNIETLRAEVAAWQASRDQIKAKINWQFTAENARIKLKRLYPTFEE